MRSKNISVLIRTIGRPTLSNAINSALDQFENIIVVADAVDLEVTSIPKITYLRTGKRFDQYGSAAINMGAYACSTPYFCLLDDDDEFFPGSSDIMESTVSSKPDVDVWIPGLKFNNEMCMCVNGDLGISKGNVAVPTYKTHLLFDFPFNSTLAGTDADYTDFTHVMILDKLGYKVDWYNHILYNVRPNLEGRNGKGKL